MSLVSPTRHTVLRLCPDCGKFTMRPVDHYLDGLCQPVLARLPGTSSAGYGPPAQGGLPGEPTPERSLP